MSCEKTREHLQAWTDSERLSGVPQEFAVLRHCLRCASCRAYWRQQRRLRQVTRHLPSELPASLEPRLFALLAAQTPDLNLAETASLPRLALSKEMKMRKRLIAATCATLAVALTGALAAQMLHHKTAAIIEDHTGHKWHITSDFLGQVKLYDTKGAMIGVVGNYQSDATPTGTVELDVEGARYQLRPGRQEIRDGQGTQLGFAELLLPDEKQPARKYTGNPPSLLKAFRQSEEDEAKFAGVSGMSASPFGAHGWDKTMGVDWKIRGSVSVRVFNAAGHETSKGEGIALTPELRRQLGANVPPVVPILEITVNGKHLRKQGYGSYDIKNEAGKVLLRLNVQSLAPYPDSASVPAPINNAPTR